MKQHSIFLATALFGVALACPNAHASNAVSRVENKAIPVLVKVDAQGKVREISPAFKLRLDFQRHVRDAIQSMITGPLEHKGRAVPSQLVMTIVPKVSVRADGRYEVRLVSVKNQPVPMGNWYWIENSHHRLALASEDNRQNWRVLRSDMGHKFHTPARVNTPPKSSPPSQPSSVRQSTVSRRGNSAR